jgi:hypothetical protein
MLKVFILFLISCLNLEGQSNYDVCHGNVLSAPEWHGETDFYLFEEGNQSFRLDAPAEAGASWIYTKLDAVEDARWELRFSFGFNPSSSNYAQVWLAMDAPSRDEAQNGLYLVIGSTADNISLWKVKDGKKELLIAGVEKILDNSAPSAAIRVTRFKGGETILETDLGEGYREEGRARVEGFESQYFGVASVYTATRSKLFWYENLSVCGEAFTDTLPPEPLPYQAKLNAVVVTEVMADPSPAVGLPATEYIELFNRGDEVVNLAGCRVETSSGSITLGKYLLFPGEYILVIPQGKGADWGFIENVVEATTWSSLPDGGGVLVMKDSFGMQISAVQYSRDYGSEGFKKDGGWALEIKDPDNISGDPANWGFSVDISGGTPGRANSIAEIYPDLNSPTLLSHYIESDSVLVLVFSEAMDSTSVSDIHISSIEAASTPKLADLRLQGVFYNELRIVFEAALLVNRGYRLDFGVLPSDLGGNTLRGQSFIMFGIPLPAEAGDVVINELLYDPPEGGSDFVELYNRSQKLIDLSSLYIARGDATGVPEKLIKLCQYRRALLPGAYLVITADKAWVIDRYVVGDNAEVVEPDGMPNYVNSGGTVLLTDNRGQTIDAFVYSNEFHMPLLRLTKGVSLERIDPYAESSSRYNWHSASAEHGYATPGKRNSQSVTPKNEEGDGFSIAPEIFTPDGDGVDDLFVIRYKFDIPGYCCTIRIYDRAGRLVRSLLNNEPVSVDGSCYWDGTNEIGALAPSGIYIVFIRCFNPEGGSGYETKKAAVLGISPKK